jgi:hypothetical protein
MPINIVFAQADYEVLVEHSLDTLPGKGRKSALSFPEFHPCRGVSPLGSPEEFVREQ